MGQRIYELKSGEHALKFILSGGKQERLDMLVFALEALDDKLDLKERAKEWDVDRT